VAGRFHETLALGHFGAKVVLVATAAAILLQAGGLYLWWRRKRVSVRLDQGWRPALVDLHHVAGVLALILMLTLSITAVAMPLVTPQEQPALRRLVMALHTAGPFPMPVKLLYMFGTTAFVVQGLTGVVMWWRPARQ
jgi:uncharacterized iron-regulated membrane protein